MAELCKEYELHASRVIEWKRQQRLAALVRWPRLHPPMTAFRRPTLALGSPYMDAPGLASFVRACSTLHFGSACADAVNPARAIHGEVLGATQSIDRSIRAIRCCPVQSRHEDRGTGRACGPVTTLSHHGSGGSTDSRPGGSANECAGCVSWTQPAETIPVRSTAVRSGCPVCQARAHRAVTDEFAAGRYESKLHERERGSSQCRNSSPASRRHLRGRRQDRRAGPAERSRRRSPALSRVAALPEESGRAGPLAAFHRGQRAGAAAENPQRGDRPAQEGRLRRPVHLPGRPRTRNRRRRHEGTAVGAWQGRRRSHSPASACAASRALRHPHVIIIWDACRTYANSDTLRDIQGGPIFPTDTGEHKKSGTIDLFLATARGEAAYEVAITSGAQAAAGATATQVKNGADPTIYKAFFTETLLQEVAHPAKVMTATIGGAPCRWCPPARWPSAWRRPCRSSPSSRCHRSSRSRTSRPHRIWKTTSFSRSPPSAWGRRPQGAEHDMPRRWAGGSPEGPRRSDDKKGAVADYMKPFKFDEPGESRSRAG